MMFNKLIREKVVYRTLLPSQRPELQQACGVRNAPRKVQKSTEKDNEKFVVDVVIKPKTAQNVHRPYKDFAYNRVQIEMIDRIVKMKIQKQVKDMVPKVYPSLEQRLFELNPENHDPELYKKINIGMSYKHSKSEREVRAERLEHIKSVKQDKDLVWKANHNELEVDIAAVQRDSDTDSWPQTLRTWAEHCGVFRHLFGPHAFFDPVVPMRVAYDYDEETVSVVHCGNIIKPSEARTQPDVSYPSAPDDLWTLLATNPDGDLYRPESECCHWLVTNIPGSAVARGDTLVPHLPPCPPRGVGYQRLVFLLFRQTRPLQHQLALSDPHSLRERSWSTLDFYRQHEDSLIPAGLRWMSSDWDHTMPDYFHNVLGMLEPVYEYDFPKPYVEPIVEYPEEEESFVTYTEKGKPEEELQEIALVERLKKVHPFKEEAPPLPYPGAVFMDPRKPSWTRQRADDDRQGLYRAKKQFRNDYSRAADAAALERAATLEVEKGYTADLDEVRREVYTGAKKRKVIDDARRAAAEAERRRRVRVADLRGETVGDFETPWRPGKVNPW